MGLKIVTLIMRNISTGNMQFFVVIVVSVVTLSLIFIIFLIYFILFYVLSGTRFPSGLIKLLVLSYLIYHLLGKKRTYKKFGGRGKGTNRDELLNG